MKVVMPAKVVPACCQLPPCLVLVALWIMNPFSLELVSIHVNRIWEEDNAVPARFAGALGVACTRLNVAVAVFAAFMVKVHVPVPEHAPLHPANVDPRSAPAVRVTLVPDKYCSEQSEPQEIPADTELTTPLPDPALLTVNQYKIVFCTFTVICVDVPTFPAASYAFAVKVYTPSLIDVVSHVKP